MNKQTYRQERANRRRSHYIDLMCRAEYEARLDRMSNGRFRLKSFCEVGDFAPFNSFDDYLAVDNDVVRVLDEPVVLVDHDREIPAKCDVWQFRAFRHYETGEIIAWERVR